MSGATCAIFYNVLCSHREYKHVLCSKVPLCSNNTDGDATVC